MLIVSFDPGYGSGISWYDTYTGEFGTEEVIGFHEMCTRLEWRLAALNDIRFVCENFVITQNTARLSGQNESLRLIGVAQYLCNKHGYDFTLQMPGARKPGEAKLKAIGWHRKTKDGHSNSASGHLLVFLLKNGLLRDEEKLKLMESL